MKPLEITSIQEYSKTQFGIVFNSKSRKNSENMGWRKGDKVLISRHGAGFFIEKISNQRAGELVKALLAVEGGGQRPEPQEEKTKKRK